METEKISFEELPLRVFSLEKKVDNLTRLMEAANRPQSVDRRLTVEETAKFLDLSPATVYTKSHRGELPMCKVGGRLFSFESDLVAYIKAGRRKTNAEIEATAAAHLKMKKGGRQC